jgi:hypothetical protein
MLAARVGYYAGEQTGKFVGQAASSIMDASVSVAGMSLPVLSAAMVAGITLFRMGQFSVKRQWKHAAVEFGAGLADAACNLVPVPIVSALMGEAARQWVVEKADKKMGVRVQDAGLVNLGKVTHAFWRARMPQSIARRRKIETAHHLVLA